jgi:lysophospholipase L1-like esterase
MPVSVPDTLMPTESVAAPHGWLHRLGKAVLWLLAIVLLFEVGLRPFGYGSYVIYRPDQRLLWVPRAGSHKVTEVNHQPITISEQGFRYRQLLGAVHPGVYRIFAFGDSVTMGWGVDDDSTYSGALESLLNGRDCPSTKFQVISAGVNAYPNALVVERMKKVLEDNYHADAVVVAYSFNTGFERLPELQGAERQKFLRRVELKSIARRSAIYNFLIEDLLREFVYYRLRELLMQGSWNTAKERPDLDVSHFTRGLEEAKAAADARNVPLILLLLGSEEETAPEHPYQKAMVEFAQANHVPLVNMIDVMRLQNRKTMFMDHVHPTALGHGLIAQQLATTVRGLNSYATVCQSGSGNSATSAVTVNALPVNSGTK